MILCREQKNDYLDPEMSMVTLDGDEDAAATFIKEYVGESFYNSVVMGYWIVRNI